MFLQMVNIGAIIACPLDHKLIGDRFAFLIPPWTEISY